MTIYKYLQPFIYKNESSDWHYSCVDRSSEYVVRVDECIRVCYWYFMGNGKLDKYGNYSSKKYKRLDKNGNIEIMDISPQGYENLLDNFNSYYGAVEDDETLTILSIGSSLTHRPRKDGGFNKETMSEGFGVVINKMTNDIVLVTLGEKMMEIIGEIMNYHMKIYQFMIETRLLGSLMTLMRVISGIKKN